MKKSQGAIFFIFIVKCNFCAAFPYIWYTNKTLFDSEIVFLIYILKDDID